MNHLSDTQLVAKLDTLPMLPGVYLMKDENADVIYVGKAKLLKKRVKSYFENIAAKDPKTQALVERIVDLDYVITKTEVEALVLECSLIKEYDPYYNIMMTDGKGYPYIRIDMQVKFPRIEVVRKIDVDGAKYFGPYTSAYEVRQALNALYMIYPMRQCNKVIEVPPKKNERACLYYQMGTCKAPCVGKITEEDYGVYLKHAIDFIKGNYKPVVQLLTQQMQEASEVMAFEKAANLRDKIAAIESMMEKQKVGSTDMSERDVIGIAAQDGQAVLQCFFIRKGAISHTQKYFLSYGDEDEKNVIAYGIKQHYNNTPDIGKRIFVNILPEEQSLIETWLSQKKGSKVQLITPQKGDNRKMLEMARDNATESLKRRLFERNREHAKTVGAADKLQAYLGIPFKLDRIECYDISNTQGTDKTASMVVFTNGKPDYKEYRKFKIKTVEGADDFKSMQEFLERRLKRGKMEFEEKAEAGETVTSGFGVIPSLIIVDGGKGQLSSAVSIMEKYEMQIPLIGLAKREEEVFLPGRSEPVIIDKDDEALKLLQRIRDEAHRFAITFHRSLRSKRTIKSELDEISGVGFERKIALLRAFGSVERIRQASLEEIENVKGIPKSTAQAIVDYFGKKEEA
jgi:excinuclease ABC subunit C